MVSIKSEREIKLMREAGQILARVHDQLGRAIEPGMSTLDIDRIGERLIMDVFLLLRIIMGILHPSAYLSMMRWFTESPISAAFSRRAISSAWMQE